MLCVLFFIVIPVVKGEAEKKPTKLFEFLQSLMPQLVPEGKPCTLEARVSDPKPVSIKWYVFFFFFFFFFITIL